MKEKQNSFLREEEYQALRHYIKIVSESGDAGMAGAMHRAIDEELTPRQRELTFMYYIDQMPMNEIAAELGLDISSVSRTLKRAREKLRRALRYGGSALMNARAD